MVIKSGLQDLEDKYEKIESNVDEWYFDDNSFEIQNIINPQ